MTMTVKELMESNTPHQIMFYDGEGMCAGILFQNHILCGCCGGVFPVDEVVENARDEGVDAIRVFDGWADVSEEIKDGNEDAAKAVTVEVGGEINGWIV